MTLIKYNQEGLIGIGIQAGVHQALLYWYTPKRRPFFTYQNYSTNKYWRI